LTEHRGFYVRYIERLIARRQAEGKPAPDICPQEYWDEWRDQHGLNQQEAERPK
jgi:hypothetical protein